MSVRGNFHGMGFMEHGSQKGSSVDTFVVEEKQFRHACPSCMVGLCLWVDIWEMDEDGCG